MKLSHNLLRQIRIFIRHIRFSWFFSLGHPAQKKQATLEALFRTTNQFLRDLGVDYWLFHGTLLGHYRDGQPLAGDVDIDLGAPESAYPKIWQARHKLPPHFKLYDTSFNHYGPKLYITHKGWEADIYFFKEADQKLHPYEKDPRAGYEVPFPKAFIYPLQVTHFFGETTYMPNQVEALLTHIYGYIEADAIQDKKTGYWYKKT